MDGLKGVVIQSKQGRHAVLATIAIDTTGDGHVFTAANVAGEDDVLEDSIHGTMNTAWLFGGLDVPR